MARFKHRSNPDRYLICRDGIYHYKRRVPLALAALDARAPMVRLSLKTDDLAQARKHRDAHESADDQYWHSLSIDGESGDAKSAYEAALVRAEALGFQYRTADAIARDASVKDILSRIEALEKSSPGSPVAAAVLGLEDKPKVTVSEAFRVYQDEIIPHELSGKSDAQKKSWVKPKRRAVDNFIKLCGDKSVWDIQREDAHALYRFWRDQIAPKEGPSIRSASSGNRDMGNMRVLYRDYFNYIGEYDRSNPFTGLSFSESTKKRRPSFSIEWIRKRFLSPGPLENLNAEARGIILVLIETGGRPSEICNLIRSNIVLDVDVPYVAIEPREDPEDPREIKTESSVRQVPLVGVALEVMKRFPNGFPRYKDRERSLSGALNKFLQENGLFETPKHTMYCFRHTFEDRMKEAQFDEEMRKILLGHNIGRPRYGIGGSLELRQREMNRIVLPFDPRVVPNAA